MLKKNLISWDGFFFSYFRLWESPVALLIIFSWFFKVILLLKLIVNKQFSCRFVDEGLSEVSVEEEGDSSIFWPSPTFSPFLSRTDLRPVSKPQFWL